MLRAAFCISLTLCPAGAADFAVWTARSLERVSRDSVAPASPSPVALAAARGETESFQVVIRTSRRYPRVSVSVPALRGPNGALIAAGRVSLYREHYVSVNTKTVAIPQASALSASGWFPDALIPLANPAAETAMLPAPAAFPVEALQNQPVWVDIAVPAEAHAGDYRGSFAVDAGGETVSGDISLKVWAYSLPANSALESSFSSWSDSSIEMSEELLRHRVSPRIVRPEHQEELTRRMGLNTADLGLWSGADYHNCSIPPPPSRARIADLVEKNHPGLRLYNYTADEIGGCPGIVPLLRDWGRALRQAGVRNLVTMTPVEDLMDDGSGSGRSAVDIWAVLPKAFEDDWRSIARAMEKGDQIWSYNALEQDTYSPKWLLHYDPLNFRLQPGFISQSLGLTGILYWRVDRWTPDPWKNVNTEGMFAPANMPGEGQLLYPGKPAGFDRPLPSMRLKWIRDGVEDYEYLALLKATPRRAWALGIARSVGRNWRDWTRSPAALEAARLQLGEELSRLGSGVENNGGQRGVAPARTRRPAESRRAPVHNP